MLKKMIMKFHHTKLGYKVDSYFFDRNIDRLAKAIYKANKGSVPEVTKKDAMNIAVGILWNNIDKVKEGLNSK